MIDIYMKVSLRLKIYRLTDDSHLVKDDSR